MKTKNMRESWPNRYRPHEKTFFLPSTLDPRPSTLDPRPRPSTSTSTSTSTLDLDHRPRPSTLDMLPSTLDPRQKPTLVKSKFIFYQVSSLASLSSLFKGGEGGSTCNWKGKISARIKPWRDFFYFTSNIFRAHSSCTVRWVGIVC